MSEGGEHVIKGGDCVSKGGAYHRIVSCSVTSLLQYVTCRCYRLLPVVVTGCYLSLLDCYLSLLQTATCLC